MSSTLKHLGVCCVLIALLKVSQSFSIGFLPDAGDAEPREDDFLDEELSTAKREAYWPVRQTRFAAPRGKRDPLVNVNAHRLLGLYINPSKFSDFYMQRQERFAAPRGKRGPYDLMAGAEYDDIEPLPYYSNFIEQRQSRSSRFAAPRGKRLREMSWDTNYNFNAPRTAKRSLQEQMGLLKRFSKPNQSVALGLSAEDIDFLLKNKDQLMRLLTLIDEGKAIGSEGYFAFPRQGRAMSFYFPRMGRAGQNTQTVKIPEDSTCCSEGVRSVYAASKGTFEICPSDQLCCAGLEEKTKLYVNLVLTHCSPFEESKFTKLRELMTEK